MTALAVQGTRERGRPKQRWLDTIKEDMKEKGIHDESRRRTELCGSDSSNTSTPHEEVGYKMPKKRTSVRVLKYAAGTQCNAPAAIW